ncbi:glycosyltransferase family 4 protein [Mycobacterium sp. EPa45]|uniref:glycosyltransferase family 4 protein n=1 Tax=Mycobacterium sp. EPa45 TaxID=1545728 RepID=UPI00064220BB|nr:glycosyltransferase family 4 protein [Mycobacterium sp. EPa45]AKK25968.1 glycosyl transferase family 1 [Mycobacterium sp. EPa45]
MAVALISAVDPYPTDAGKKVVLAGFVDYLTERYGHDNVHYIKVGSVPNQQFPVRMHVVPGPSRREVLGNVMTRVLTGRMSLQEAFLGSSQTAAGIAELLDQIHPDLQIYDTVRMAQYAPNAIAAQQVCYLDDLFSERYDRMLRAADEFGDINISPLGNFAEHVPAKLRPLATHRRSQTMLLRAERSLVRRSEDRTARRFRRSLLVNADEADVLMQRTGMGPDRIQSIPPLIAVPAGPERHYDGAPEFAFLGLLSLPHNDDGLRSFLETAWPLILKRHPDARLRIIGREARPELLALAAKWGDSVVLEGFVPDLGTALAGVAALVNPLRFGSGIKLKVIEALGRALPVVSTPIGAEGIASGPGTGVLLGRQPAEFVELLCSLTEPAVNAEISAQAREHFRTTYSRSAVFAAYDTAFSVCRDEFSLC